MYGVVVVSRMMPLKSWVIIGSGNGLLTKLVTSSHRLKIETGRWQRPMLPRENRICVDCVKLNDKYHFPLECSAC